MKNYKGRNKHTNKLKISDVSSEMLLGMDDLVFESVSLRTDVWNKKLKVPVSLFYKMLETMQVNKDNREFVQRLKEYTMLISVDYSNILIDDFEEMEKLYFELLDVIYEICNNKKDLEGNRQMALSLMDLYPFIMEVLKNREYLLIYSEKLSEKIWE